MCGKWATYADPVDERIHYNLDGYSSVIVDSIGAIIHQEMKRGTFNHMSLRK